MTWHRIDDPENDTCMTDRVSPLTIKMALAYASGNPEQFFSRETWESQAALKVRTWMHENELLDGPPDGLFEPTPKLHAWIAAICSVPLPRQEWVIEWPRDFSGAPGVMRTDWVVDRPEKAWSIRDLKLSPNPRDEE